MRRFLVACCLTIVLNGELPVETLSLVMEDLRAVAVKAGCPADRVRAEVRWRGAGQPAELVIRCAEARDRALVPKKTVTPSQ